MKDNNFIKSNKRILIEMYQSEELTEPYRYKMAAGIVTNDK